MKFYKCLLKVRRYIIIVFCLFILVSGGISYCSKVKKNIEKQKEIDYKIEGMKENTKKSAEMYRANHSSGERERIRQKQVESYERERMEINKRENKNK